MLTLFIVNSDSQHADRAKTEASFGDIPQHIVPVWNFKDINTTQKNTEWYGVIYDDEYIEDALKVSLNIFFESDADVLIVYRKELTDELHITKAPRFFRKHVLLQEESLLPQEIVYGIGVNLLKFETILNGWIISHASDSVQSGRS